MTFRPHADPQSVYPRITRRGFPYGLSVLVGVFIIGCLVAAVSNGRRYRRYYNRPRHATSPGPARNGGVQYSDYTLSATTGRAPSAELFWLATGFEPGRTWTLSRLGGTLNWAKAREKPDIVVADVPASDLPELASLKIAQRIRFVGSQSDEVLRHLSSLQELEEVWLSTSMKGTGLKYLVGLPRLSRVYLADEANLAGIARLQELKSLKELSITKAQLGGAEVNVLVSLGLETLRLKTVKLLTSDNQRWPGNLKELQLIRCAVSDRELFAMTQGSAKLQTLVLYDTFVGMSGLQRLRIDHRDSLQRLWLKSGALTDAALDEVARLFQLRELVLELPKMTDRGSEKLARRQHASLRKIHLVGTRVSFSGVNRLQRAHQQCEIIY